MLILKTERLYLREMDQGDYQWLCKMLQDPKVMYAYEHWFTKEEVQDWLDKQISRYKKDGFGLWAVVLQDTHTIVGQCGLTMQTWDDKQVVEVGYLLQKEFWQHGYATEAAIACKKYAFEKLAINEVYSIIRDNNISSQKVAIRNGMTIKGHLVKEYHGIIMPHLVFAVKNKN